jgi:hypothetical protein
VAAGLGGIVLGGGLGLEPALANKRTRKAVKRAKKQSKQKCRKQEGQCTASFTGICTTGNTDPADAAACIAQFSACCAFLSDCQVTSFFDCVFTPR